MLCYVQHPICDISLIAYPHIFPALPRTVQDFIIGRDLEMQSLKTVHNIVYLLNLLLADCYKLNIKDKVGIHRYV